MSQSDERFTIVRKIVYVVLAIGLLCANAVIYKHVFLNKSICVENTDLNLVVQTEVSGDYCTWRIHNSGHITRTFRIYTRDESRVIYGLQPRDDVYFVTLSDVNNYFDLEEIGADKSGAMCSNISATCYKVDSADRLKVTCTNSSEFTQTVQLQLVVYDGDIIVYVEETNFDNLAGFSTQSKQFNYNSNDYDFKVLAWPTI